jgi:hypothetical protein
MSLARIKCKGVAGPCKTLSAEQRDEIEPQMRAQGRLRAVSAAELMRMRNETLAGD